MKDFSYQLGNYVIAPATAIAPMEGLTDPDFRQMISEIGGCGLSVTEFVNVEALTRDVEKVWAMTRTPERKSHATAVQIYGHKVESMARAALMCEQRGAQIVDLNLGCPAKKVVGGMAGSALMKDPAHAEKIFRAVNAAVSIPWTVKMRLGWHTDSMNSLLIARMAEDAGASQVALHARTRSQSYRGHADWALARETFASLSIPTLINGDILTIDDARQALLQSGATGVMVGRGLLRNPWLLRQITDSMSGREMTMPTLLQRRDFVLSYIERMRQRGVGVRRIMGKTKCFIGYFSRALAHASRFREQIYHSDTLESIVEKIVGYFDFLMANDLDGVFSELDAAVVDPRLRDGDARGFYGRRNEGTAGEKSIE